MRGVEVDPDARTARVLGGTLLGEVDAATHEHGLAAPFGIISTTGRRRADARRRCRPSDPEARPLDRQSARGRCRSRRRLASSTANEDRARRPLLGASRRRRELRCRDGVHVPAQPDQHRHHRARCSGRSSRRRRSSSWYSDFIPQQPDELNGFFAFLAVPPADPFPEELHLQKVCARRLVLRRVRRSRGRRAPRACAKAPTDPGRRRPGSASRRSSRAFDGVYPHGRSVVLARGLRPRDSRTRRSQATRRVRRAAADLEVDDAHLSGRRRGRRVSQPTRPPGRTATRDGCRSSSASIPTRPTPALVREWAVGYWEAVHPYSMGGAYVNLMMEEGEDRVRRDATGTTTVGSRAIKATYDPENLFHVNQNIRPA